MNESINFFVGLDAHKDSIAVAVCEAGREPSRFVGNLGPDVQGVLKTLRKYGPARQVSVVYEAGPTGYGLPPGIRTHAWKAQVRLCSRFAQLSSRGVQANKVCVAVARELTGFVWAMAQQAASSPAAR